MPSLRRLAVLFAVCAGPLGAQTVVLHEDFSAGVPPAGWSESHGWAGGWTEDPTAPGAAFHDDVRGLADSWLVTPPLDLRGLREVWLHADQTVDFADWRLLHAVEVSTDQGATWTRVLADTSPDGGSVLRADLSAWAGRSGVLVAFHYEGNYASEWRLDNVQVSDLPLRVLRTALREETGSLYALLDPSGWRKAAAVAEAVGGRLVTVEDAAENTWLLDTFGGVDGSPRHLWIGLSDAKAEGEYRWLDGTAPAWTNWAPGQPDDSPLSSPDGEDYVRMYGRHAWQGEGRWADEADAPALGELPLAWGVVEYDGPVLQAGPLRAGAFVSFELHNLGPGHWTVIAWSNSGRGPTPSRAGNLLLSDPILTFPSVQADARGEAALAIWFGPEARGLPFWFHALDLEAGRLSNPLFGVAE